MASELIPIYLNPYNVLLAFWALGYFFTEMTVIIDGIFFKVLNWTIES